MPMGSVWMDWKATEDVCATRAGKESVALWVCFWTIDYIRYLLSNRWVKHDRHDIDLKKAIL